MQLPTRQKFFLGHSDHFSEDRSIFYNTGLQPVFRNCRFKGLGRGVQIPFGATPLAMLEPNFFMLFKPFSKVFGVMECIFGIQIAQFFRWNVSILILWKSGWQPCLKVSTKETSLGTEPLDLVLLGDEF